MGLAIPVLIDGVRKKLGLIDTVDITDARVLLWLNKSFWAVMDNFDFKSTEGETRISTVVGQRDYDVFTDIDVFLEAIQSVSIVEDANDGKHKLLKRYSKWEYEENYQEITDANGPPERYFRHAHQLRLWPTPDAIYDLPISYTLTLTDLVNDPAVYPPFPNAWHEILELGGAWRGAMEIGDADRIKLFEDQQTKLLRSISPIQGKEENDSRMATANVIKPTVNWR